MHALEREDNAISISKVAPRCVIVEYLHGMTDSRTHVENTWSVLPGMASHTSGENTSPAIS
jgi:hypothetical protein